MWSDDVNTSPTSKKGGDSYLVIIFFVYLCSPFTQRGRDRFENLFFCLKWYTFYWFQGQVLMIETKRTREILFFF